MDKEIKKLKQAISIKKEKLNKLLEKDQTFTHETMCLSQELDVLIVQYYKMKKEVDKYRNNIMK